MAQGLDPAGAFQLPGYEVLEKLGEGGMGTVHRARQLSLDRDVAVKILAGEWADDPGFLERLEREARTMARLRHPHIVAIHSFERLEDGRPAIIMEHVAGGSLRDRLRQHPQGLPVAEVIRLTTQIGEALGSAHGAGLIHRDVKPENVLLEPNGAARVTDFGIALATDSPQHRLTLTQAAVGTVDYMAPEQMEGGPVDQRTDVFALGAMVYELLTGRPPRGSFSAPHRLRRDVPLAASEAVMKALRPRAEERFTSMEAFLKAFRSPSRRHPYWLASGLILLAAAAVVIAMTWQPDSQTGKTDAVPVPASIVPEPGPWRDLLAGVQLPEFGLKGEWRLEGTGVTSNEQICLLKLEDEMPESYDIRTTFIRRSGEHSVAVFFTANDSIGSCELDAWSKSLAGFQLIDGRSLEDGYGVRQGLENGRRYELLLEVRRRGLRLVLDGKELQKTTLGTGERLSPPVPWWWDTALQPAALALGAYESPTHFEKVEWREVPLP